MYTWDQTKPAPKHSNIETIGTPPTSKPYFIEACRGYSDSPDLGPLRDAMELLCWLFLRFFLPLPGAMWQPVLLSLVAHLVIWCLLHWIEYLVCTWSEQHSMSDCWKTRKLGAWPIFLLPRPRRFFWYSLRLISSSTFIIVTYCDLCVVTNHQKH